MFCACDELEIVCVWRLGCWDCAVGCHVNGGNVGCESGIWKLGIGGVRLGKGGNRNIFGGASSSLNVGLFPSILPFYYKKLI